MQHVTSNLTIKVLVLCSHSLVHSEMLLSFFHSSLLKMMHGLLQELPEIYSSIYSTRNNGSRLKTHKAETDLTILDVSVRLLDSQSEIRDDVQPIQLRSTHPITFNPSNYDQPIHLRSTHPITINPSYYFHN